MNFPKYGFIFIGLILLASCNSDEVCTENIDTKANMNFVNLTIDGETITENELSLNNLIVFPIERNNDSLYNYQNEVLKISLPLNPNTTFTSFAIQADGTQDTIYLHYQSDMHYVSLICGFIWFFNLAEVTHTTHAIDSLIVMDSLIDLNERINYKIYYR